MGTLFDLTAVSSLASAAVAKEAKLPAAERTNVADHYAARAVETLTNSLPSRRKLADRSGTGGP